MDKEYIQLVEASLIGTLYIRHDLVGIALNTIPSGIATGMAGNLIELYRGNFKGGNELDVPSFQAGLTRLKAWDYLQNARNTVLNPSGVGEDQVIKWAKAIARNGTNQAAQKQLSKWADELNKGADLEAIVGDIITGLNSMGTEGVIDTWKTARQIADTALLKIQKWADYKDTPLVTGGIRTGFPSLDRVLDDVPNGEILVIAARPSMGKTTLATQILENVARYYKENNIDEVVGVFTAEQGGDILALHLACARSGVELKKLKKGLATPEELDRVNHYLNYLFAELPIVADESPNPTTENMKLRALALNNRIIDGRKKRVGLLVFDYAELAGDMGEGDNEINRMTLVAKRLKAIAKILKCPVIVIAQVGRQVDGRVHKMPQISDIRGSDAWSQLAYQIIFILRESYYVRTSPEYEPHKDPHYYVAQVGIAKSKDSDVGTILLGFIPELTRFFDINDPTDDYRKYLLPNYIHPTRENLRALFSKKKKKNDVVVIREPAPDPAKIVAQKAFTLEPEDSPNDGLIRQDGITF
jgi:replicative DNA helicase